MALCWWKLGTFRPRSPNLFPPSDLVLWLPQSWITEGLRPYFLPRKRSISVGTSGPSAVVPITARAQEISLTRRMFGQTQMVHCIFASQAPLVDGPQRK